jgi:beta-lactamase superfamily II metal-dependent hydrolase
MEIKLHFLNVGNGDCTIIELPDGNLMMVDICNGGGTNSELTDPISYLYDLQSKRILSLLFVNPIAYLHALLSKPKLFRYVQTHPDMDHMDGLSLLERKCTIINFWDTDNTKPRPDFSSPYSKGKPEDWDAYQRLRQKAKRFYRSLSPVTLRDGQRYPYDLYVLHPTREAVYYANQSGDWNHVAYVLLLKFKSFKALIAGDVDNGVWEELYDWASRDNTARDLVSNITVFKVSHHGRRSGYCGSDWLNLTNPKEIVISKGSVPGEQSAYGNYYNYKKGAEHLWLTSRGDVICCYDSVSNKYSIKYRG